MSPYQTKGNNPILYNDPDGDFIPQLVGGVVGGALNVFNDWDKILSNSISAFGYAATGIGASIVATLPGGLVASRAILSIGNVATDIASGNLPRFEGISDVAGYVGGTAFDAFSAAGASKAFGQIAKTSLKKAALKAGKELVEEGAFSLIGEAELAEMTLRWHGQEIGAGIFFQVNAKAINWGARAAGSIGMGAVSGQLGLTHQHHVHPKALGGPDITVPMDAEDHKQLHRDLNEHLKRIKDKDGFDMYPRKGNKGKDVVERFGPEKVKKEIGKFYKGKIGRKYKSSADAFFKILR